MFQHIEYMKLRFVTRIGIVSVARDRQQTNVNSIYVYVILNIRKYNVGWWLQCCNCKKLQWKVYVASHMPLVTNCFNFLCKPLGVPEAFFARYVGMFESLHLLIQYWPNSNTFFFHILLLDGNWLDAIT